MARKQKTKYDIFIEKRNDLLAYITIGITIVVFLFVLIRTIIFPGYTFCSSRISCPSRDPVISDIPTVIVVVILYFFPFLFGLLLVASPGALMDRPFRNKIIAMFSLFLISWSMVQLISPIFYRYYVVPYSILQDFNITITRTLEGNAYFEVDNLYSTLLQTEFVNNYGVSQLYAAVSVFLVSESIDKPYLLAPIGNTAVYDNSDLNSSTILNETQIIYRTISGLQENNFYLFIVDYAKPQTDGTDITILNSLLNVQTSLLNVTLLPNNIQNEISSNTTTSIYVDFRAYIHCKWTLDGCTV